ncbi:hypothetical protein [Glutamicibacter mysorens]|uniref:hypothetical protein n=1 Tax=Glutamicibacter mysorens TaxID=257984 RepID=UPI0012EE65B2|nr:hypothetical protein [Glutamicibacter mysorens]
MARVTTHWASASKGRKFAEINRAGPQRWHVAKQPAVRSHIFPAPAAIRSTPIVEMLSHLSSAAPLDITGTAWASPKSAIAIKEAIKELVSSIAQAQSWQRDLLTVPVCGTPFRKFDVIHLTLFRAQQLMGRRTHPLSFTLQDTRSSQWINHLCRPTSRKQPRNHDGR